MCQVSYDLRGLFPLVKGCRCSHGHFWSFSQERGVIIKEYICKLLKWARPIMKTNQSKFSKTDRETDWLTDSVEPARFTSSRRMSELSDALYSPVKQISTLRAIRYALCVCLEASNLHTDLLTLWFFYTYTSKKWTCFIVAPQNLGACHVFG